ncbi:MAG: helix-turn-helix transcriptional regulator [Clostridiales bacterium]|nr:helix-turn-helix transcriptional regulator [Clostridiales bacterium]
MRKIRSDLLIKRLRQERGLTQERLSRGICSLSTLSKIERGEHVPTFWVFKQLMQRLGENPGKYWFGVATLEDRQIVRQRDEIERLLWENTAESNDEAEKLMGNFMQKLRGGGH